MNTIKLKKIFATMGFVALMGTTLLAPSCSDNRVDELFDKTANERVDEAAQSLRTLLTSSSEGWVLEYIPSSGREYGAYHIGLKFSAKGEVLATTELLADPTQWLKSEYTIGKDKNLSINFDTYNEAIHRYSTPDTDQAGGRGKGFLGDYEFNIVERVSDDELRVRGKKTGNYMTLRRATGSIDAYIASVLATKAKAYSNASMSARNQDALVGNLGGKTQLFKLNTANLHAFSMTTEGSLEARTISYFFTPTGIRLVTPVEGVTEFTWSDANQRYESPSGNLVARRDPTYDDYAKYLGEYTMAIYNADGSVAESFDVTFTETGYREYTITGAPFTFKATYNNNNDRFEIYTQDIGKTNNGLRIILGMWDSDAGFLSWSPMVGMYSHLVPNSSPARYVLVDNGAWGQNKAMSFILWRLTADGSSAGRSEDFENVRYIKPTFTRK